jgi:hypothetical protein
MTMRRKVLQDFANVFCQRVIDLPSGYDLASFARCGSGKYALSILTGECSHNGVSIPKLNTCDVYDEWLSTQLAKHGIQKSHIEEARLEIDVVVQNVSVRASYGHRFASAHFFFDCHSEIRTNEKVYRGHMAGNKEWGFDWYYEKLYGKLPDVWLQPPSTLV